MSSSLERRAATEGIGTFALVFVAAGAAMTDEISGGGLGIVGNALASGLVITGMIYAVGHISGAHINPAAFVPSEDWGIEDPAGEDIHRVRRIRDQVEANVRQLLLRPTPRG